MVLEALAAAIVVSGIAWCVVVGLRAGGPATNRALADHAVRTSRALFNQGRLDEADAHLDRALARVPDHGGAWTGKANVLLRRRRIPQALAAVERALAAPAMPTAPHLLRLRGLLLMMLGRYAEALAEFERCLARDPSDPLAWQQRAGCLWRLGRAGEALGAAEEAAARLPGVPEVWAGLAALRLRHGRAAEAVTACDRALGALAADAPPLVRADAWHTRAVALATLGRPEEALAASDEAIRLAPESGLIASIRARALAALARAGEAEAEATRALELLDREDREREPHNWGRAPDPAVAAASAVARRDALRALGRHAEAEEVAERAREAGW